MTEDRLRPVVSCRRWCPEEAEQRFEDLVLDALEIGDPRRRVVGGQVRLRGLVASAAGDPSVVCRRFRET